MSVRFLATCFIHSPLGSDVIPPMHTQRVAISMTAPDSGHTDLVGVRLSEPAPATGSSAEVDRPSQSDHIATETSASSSRSGARSLLTDFLTWPFRCSRTLIALLLNMPRTHSR